MNYETTLINPDDDVTTDGSYPTVSLNTDEGRTVGKYPMIALDTDVRIFSDKTYETFMGSLRSVLKSGDKNHDIDLLRKPSQIDNTNMFVEVQLFYRTNRFISITLGISVFDANVVGYRSEIESFFFKDAPPSAKTLLFAGTRKRDVDLSTNYENLADRTKIGLSAEKFRKAIGILHNFRNIGKTIPSSFKNSLVVVLQMVSEAARFEFVEKYMKLNLIGDGYFPGGDTSSYEDAWCLLSDQIRQSDSNGIFKTPVKVRNADDSFKYITDVANVESDISILLQKPMYPAITYNNTTEDTSNEGYYGTFIISLRDNLTSTGATSHDIPILRKSSEITNDNMFVLVELFYDDDDDSISATKKVSITLALHVLNANLIGYKSEYNSFFFLNAPSEAQDFLFYGTTKKAVNVYASYAELRVSRNRTPLNRGALKNAIDIFYKFDGESIDTAFKESVVVVMQMVSEAARFKFIQGYIERSLKDDEFKFHPMGKTTSYENKWSALSTQIQLSGEDGKFKIPVKVRNLDYTTKYVITVDEVKPDIAILLELGETGEMYDDGNDVMDLNA